MSTQRSKISSAPQLPAKSNLELALSRGSQVSAIVLAVLGILFALRAGSFLLIPVSLAIVVGLMLAPVASAMERHGARPSLSAAVTVLIFILLLGSLVTAVATPLTSLAERVPQIWNELQFRLTSLAEPLSTFKDMREQIRSVTGDGGATISVEEGSAVESVATVAPALLAQVLIFLGGLYFFMATRHDIRLVTLKLCSQRRVRRRAALIFLDVEELVSNYLLSITIINIGLGLAVGIALWLMGVPSALLWGALAGVLNFIIYIGPAVMAVILLGVGLATFGSFSGSFLPPLVYLAINALEAQFITPMVIGQRLTLNPFLVFLAVAFWIWMWGPVGGFIAIPALLILFAIARNLIPGFKWGLSEDRRRQLSRLP